METPPTIHLRSVSLEQSDDDPLPAGFPFSVPAIASMPEIKFTSPVTFLVGENGSGKSTFIEALAAGVRSVAVGGDDIERDPSLVHARRLAGKLRFTWNKKTRRGFFMRAEDFFRFIQRMQETRRDLEDMNKDFASRLSGRGLTLAQATINAQMSGMTRRYGEDPDANSHGEGFLKLFHSRFVPNGLYLLDEPEAPLSPQRQFALLMLLRDMVAQGAQFIIATHSPILMAYPGARILTFDGPPIKEIGFEETEHVTFTRAFLNDPERYIRQLDP